MASAPRDQPGDDASNFDQSQRGQMTLVASRAPVVAPAATGAFVSGTVLAPGSRFDHHDNVAAIVLKSGPRVEAQPGMYFATSRQGRTIRLWQRTVPGVDRDSRQLAWWWAKRDVSEVLSQPELARRHEEEHLGARSAPIIIRRFDAPTQTRSNHTSIWQGVIVAVLLAAIVAVWLTVFGVLTPPDAPALTAEQLAAIFGTGALLIFGVTCMALVQNTGPRQG